MMQTATPKISVITCFLNAERYLEEAVESVLAQEYANWELLLIDDGSTDNSTALAKQYAAQYPGQIIYLEHEGHINRGLSATRNVGIRYASGEYISFLDADDVWLPKLLSNLLALLQEHKVPMVCEATEYWYSSNQQEEDHVVQIGITQDHTFLPPRLMEELYPLSAGSAPCMCGILVRKDLLHQYDGFEEAFTGMYEDQVFLSKFYLQEPIYISSSCNNRYRQHDDSMVQTSWNTDYHQVRLRYLEWLQGYLQQQNLHYPKITKLLHNALKPYRPTLLRFISDRLPQQGKHLLSRIKRKIGPNS